MSRQERWEKNLEMLKSGALGDDTSPETLLRYWKMQERAGYPYASENVKYYEQLLKTAEMRKKKRTEIANDLNMHCCALAEMELNRERIIKELILFIDDNPVELHFNYKKTSKFLSFLKLVLDVITTDEQKIKELTEKHKMLSESYDYIEKAKDNLLAERSRLIEENERLRAENDELCDDIACLEFDNENAERRTVRKMQERLTKEFNRMHITNFLTVEVRQWIIDQIAKEMIGEEND